METEIPIEEWNPETYDSKTYKKVVGCGSIYITIVYDKNDNTKIIQCLLDGSTKNILCLASNIALADMTTFALRHTRYPSEYKAILKNLRGNKCSQYKPNEEHNLSCADVFGKILSEILLNEK
jgi:hypothetical protein